MYNLADKVALVTGAGRPRGIGRATARRLAREGAAVVVSDSGQRFADMPDYQHLGWHEDVEQAVAETQAAGGRAIGVALDVTNAAQIEAALDRAVAAFGRIDILVNNAGMGVVAPLLETSEAQWDKVQAVNLKGPFLCAVAAARRLIAQGGGGKIITVASQAAKTGFVNLGAYCASKHGVVGFTRVLALELELAPHNIQVNAVCPGTVDTELMLPLFEATAQRLRVSIEEAKRRVAQTIPLGRLETGDDVANLIAFLASAESDYMTGQAINVTGGQEMQ